VFEIFAITAIGFTYAIWQLLYFISVGVMHTVDGRKNEGIMEALNDAG
jgi:hypothetical protein